jgi:hypothetical protein
MPDRRTSIRWPYVCAWVLAVVTIVSLMVICMMLLAGFNGVVNQCIDKLGQT